MKKLACLCFALCFAAHSSYAQTSIFEDSKGESSIKAFKNSITVNTADPNIALDFNTFQRRSTTPKSKAGYDKFERLGILAKLKANEGVSALKNEDGFLVDGQLGLYYGLKNSLPAPIKTDEEGEAYETYFSANISLDRSEVYDLTRTKDVVYAKSSTGWKAEIGRFGYVGNLLYGVGANFGYSNNIEELSTKSIFLNSTSLNGNTAVKSKTAFDITEYKKNLFNSNLNGDIALLLNRQAAADSSSETPPIFAALHFRANYLDSYKVRLNPAAGIYLAKKGAPRNVVAGLNFQILDLLNSQNEESSAWDRLSISLNAGFQIK
ncbi:hypothetical protein [Hymenobacter cellulosivorans]|uniref:DUF3078 domain-containing protein n=1 Tax=Hymenobacter cellulosivorans TaxID=2932249 RepID=A0ABY4FCD3_9BACT|nr:hypothetical protein [Hymenobacter cellulosivorans]UOQ54325.1 hypothetical protein MUN80_06090 [Hymenobacter cellulosivorans]